VSVSSIASFKMSFRTESIYYVPGLISLAISSFIFRTYAQDYLKSLNRHVIEINWFTPDLVKMYPTIFTESYPPKREYAIISISGNDNTDQLLLDSARKRIRKIIYSEDSSTGIHFIFGNQSRYGTFVKTLDILQAEGATYMPYKNNLWFYHLRQEKTADTELPIITGITCGDINDVRVTKKEESTWERIAKYVLTTWNVGWQMIAAYILFLLSIMIVRMMNNRTQSGKVP
jgi:hypothetical protein